MAKRGSKKRLWLKVTAVPVILGVLYGGLLTFPQPFFPFSVSADNLTLYSDQPFDADAGKNLLEMTEAKLSTSPLYSASDRHRIFICNARWRQRIFFTYKYGAGGINYYPITSNVFLRDAEIDEDRLIAPSGNPVPGDRPLDYFVTHEITHTLTTRGAGWYRHWRLPEWIREGYPDYVGKGSGFDYDKARQAFLDGAPEMDRQGSGLYYRYHLLVAYLLDRQHWTVDRLLHEPIDQATVEDEIRKDAGPADSK